MELLFQCREFRFSASMYLLMHLEATRIQGTNAGTRLGDRYIAVRIDMCQELSTRQRNEERTITKRSPL